MTEYEQRIVHKIEMHTFSVATENREMLACLELDRVASAAHHLINLKYYVDEIDILLKKLVISKGL